MKPIKHLAYVIVLFAVYSIGGILPVEAAEKRCDPWAAKAVSVQGIVKARKAGETHWAKVKLNDTFLLRRHASGAGKQPGSYCPQQ